MQTIKNNYGISVKMMCASCEFKMNTESVKKRRCTRKRKMVKPRGYCTCWKMTKGLQNAGKQP